MIGELTSKPVTGDRRTTETGVADLGFVALAHDYLNQNGGAERVVLELAAMWPQAPIYTSMYRPGSTLPGFGEYEVFASPLDRLPVDRGFRNLLPLYPAAFASFGTLAHDVVISSSSGWAHSVRTAPDTFHAVYCYTPARWLYGGDHFGDTRHAALKPFGRVLRRWDRAAARRADLYIAISHEVRRRIKREYGLDAPVVFPPVDVERFRPGPRGERLLVVSRLLPYKRVDAIVDVATRAGIGLDVVGSGPALADLRRRAGPTITFHGRLADAAVTRMMERCRALCLPGNEDFGISPVEANAAGKPVVAFAAGGALETIQDGVTGTFFTRYEHGDMLAAIRRCDEIDTAPAVIAEHAQRFSRTAFRRSLLDALEPRVHEHQARTQIAHRGRRTAAAATEAPQRPSPERAPGRDAHPRVLMLGKGWFPDELGGLDRYYRDLLEQLDEAQGVVVGARQAPHARVTGVCDHDRPLARRLYEFWRATARLADGVDVVDAHFGLYALAPLLIGRLRRTPVVLHFHGPWADENVAAGDGSTLRRHGRRMLERAAYRRAREAVVLTSAFRQVLVERYGVRPWNVHVQPPGVDLARFAPGPAAAARGRFDLAADAFVAVAVRRLVPRMGLEVLVDAWEVAVASLPPASTLLIVGDGPLRGALQRLIAARGLGGSVRLLGRIADDDLVDLYRAADVGVVPTIEHEGFGLVVVEAAACGTPSIVTATGGLPEAVAGLDASLAVAPGDAGALGARLLRAVEDRPGPGQCRAFAERYAWPAVAERHRAIARRAAGWSGSLSGDDRLKVVYLDHVAQMSGGEIALLRLLPHLDRVNPHVVLAQDGPLVEALHLAGISVEVLALDERARGLRKADVGIGGVDARVAAATAAYTVRLARHLRHLRPDVVHTNSLKSGVYGSVAARMAGVPVVWHVRDRIAGDYLPSSAIALIRHMSRHFASAVVANSNATMATLEADSSPTVVYSVVPEVMHGRAPSDRVRGGCATTFGIVGRLAPWKGQDLFLRAFARAFPDGPERAVVVGGALFGEDDFEREIVALAEALGIAGRVEFRGHCENVWDELARLDVLVHASRTPEPFGQVVLEGMAAGVPVIAAGAGGPAEILDDGRTGLLYEPNDAGALASCMRAMLAAPLRERLADAARTEVRRYEPEIVAAELQRLYAAVVSPPPVR